MVLSKSSGCVACCILLDNQRASRALGDRAAKKPSKSEDFGSTSTLDMDNSTIPSQGNISSISTTDQIFDSQIATGSSNAPSEFVNHGLLRWNQTRQSWVGRKRSSDCLHRKRKLNWNATYDSLLGSNKPFPKPVPLSEMVDFLVDIWEQEGLYD